MSKIIKSQIITRDESFGINSVIEQISEYESVSDTITIEVFGSRITMSIDEWRSMFDLMNECLITKCKKL